MNRKIFGQLAAVGVLFATACSTDDALNGTSGNTATGEEVTVTFSITPEGYVTRAGGDNELPVVHYPDATKGEYPQISDGSKTNKLIYAVYDEDKKLLDQYGDSNGQVIMNGVTFPTQKISLRLMRNKTYFIAFWAQDANCTYYDTQDLQKVKVIYTNEGGTPALNNDESRDAFCKVETLSVAGDEERNVILYRPLAQINVGTAGYDYELAAEQSNKTKFLYSRIKIDGVSEYIDVVDNKVLTTEEDFKTHGLTWDETKGGTVEITYGWNVLPAYCNYDNVSTPKDIEDYPAANIPTKDANESPADWYKKFQEQFLRVDINYDGKYEPYVSWKTVKETQPTEGNDYSYPSPDTEIYKYLSMCYVLVPAHTVQTDNGEEDYNSTLNSVIVQLATDADGSNLATVVGKVENNVEKGLGNVPVQRNWRTNIVGKNIITVPYKVYIDIIPEYNGEHNSIGEVEHNHQDDNVEKNEGDGIPTRPNESENGQNSGQGE